MNLSVWLYIINATLLIIHEIESAYEKEWNLLKLPFGLTGFLIIHIPIVILFFYGLLEMYHFSQMGKIFGLFTGICGIIPVLIHKIFFKYNDHFNRIISSLIIYANMIVAIALITSIFI